MWILVEVVAIVVGQAFVVAAVFGGTNLRIENPWVFFGGFALAVVAALVARLSQRRQGE